MVEVAPRPGDSADRGIRLTCVGQIGLDHEVSRAGQLVRQGAGGLGTTMRVHGHAIAGTGEIMGDRVTERARRPGQQHPAPGQCSPRARNPRMRGERSGSSTSDGVPAASTTPSAMNTT